MNGGGDYHRSGCGAEVFERGKGGVFGAGDKTVVVSERSEKVHTKNETATDFRL